MRGTAMTSAAPTRIQLNDDLRSSGRGKCTIRFRSFETRLKQEVLTFDVRVSSVSGAVGYGGCEPIPACRSRTEAVRLNRGRNKPNGGDAQILTGALPVSCA